MVVMNLYGQQVDIIKMRLEEELSGMPENVVLSTLTKLKENKTSLFEFTPAEYRKIMEKLHGW